MWFETLDFAIMGLFFGKITVKILKKNVFIITIIYKIGEYILKLSAAPHPFHFIITG